MKTTRGSILFQVAVWMSLLAAGTTSEVASAQQVEIVANETVVRLDPDATSPVITTLAAGTVLEWVGEYGPYFAVSVPGPPGQENLVGYVLASEVAVVGAARPGSPGASDGGMEIPGVAEQHAAAKANRAAGLKRAALGAGMAATAEATISIAFEVKDEEQYEDEAAYQAALDRESTAGTYKKVALIGGAALAAYGIGRYVLGWRKMAELEREFPEATTPSLDRQYAEASLSRSLGKRKVFWGALLAGASIATVEWVPYFSDPVPEDFENASEFQDAVNRRDKAESGRNWITGVGGVLGVWGVAQWVLASQKIGEVEELTRMSSLSMQPASSAFGSPVTLFVDRDGPRTRFGVTWSR